MNIKEFKEKLSNERIEIVGIGSLYQLKIEKLARHTRSVYRWTMENDKVLK